MNHVEMKSENVASDARVPVEHTASSTTNESAMVQELRGGSSSLRSLRSKAEVIAISNALERTSWNRKRAARVLCISYRGLLYKIRQHKITPPNGNQVTPLIQREG